NRETDPHWPRGWGPGENKACAVRAIRSFPPVDRPNSASSKGLNRELPRAPASPEGHRNRAIAQQIRIRVWPRTRSPHDPPARSASEVFREQDPKARPRPRRLQLRRRDDRELAGLPASACTRRARELRDERRQESARALRVREEVLDH